MGSQVVEKDGQPLRFYDVKYPLPDEVVRGKKKVAVRFQATNGNEIACLFGLRMVREGPPGGDGKPGK